MNEERLLNAITTTLEEYGMPKFQDKLPAMDVLQLVKDSGYSKQAQVLDKKEVIDFIKYTGFLPTNTADVCIEQLGKALCAKFSPTPGVTETELDKLLDTYLDGEYWADRGGQHCTFTGKKSDLVRDIKNLSNGRR